jgi:hypothetical protein
MADINIDTVRKQKKAEYSKQYRLKRKLLLHVLLLCVSFYAYRLYFINVWHVYEW